LRTHVTILLQHEGQTYLVDTGFGGNLYKDTDWKIGYAFDTKRPLENLSELNEVQGIIVEHKESRFNKPPLIT
jgi:N-hydroxyarylamine O-acetyltransferase